MKSIADILELTDPDEIFDLICAHNYFAGHLGSGIPINELRKVFNQIKKLLKEERKAK